MRGVEQEQSRTHNPDCIWTDQVCIKTGEREEREREGEEETGKLSVESAGEREAEKVERRGEGG